MRRRGDKKLTEEELGKIAAATGVHRLQVREHFVKARRMANRVRAHRRAARERVRRRSIQRSWRENVHQLAASREPEAMAQEMKERDIKKEGSLEHCWRNALYARAEANLLLANGDENSDHFQRALADLVAAYPCPDDSA
eukprot:g3656.t1